MAEPTAADCALAKSLWQRMSALTEDPEKFAHEWEPIAQAMADARVAGVAEGLEKAARKISLYGGNAKRTKSINCDRAARMFRAMARTGDDDHG